MLYYAHKVEERQTARTYNPNMVKAGDTKKGAQRAQHKRRCSLMYIGSTA